MIARETIDSAEIPGGGSLKLVRRGQEYSIMLGANELMNSRLSGSEEALATLALAALGGRGCGTMLIGGLGMGFTLRAALAGIGAEARIVVAELVPAVIDWARGPMAHVHGDSLADPRVALIAGDVADLIDGADAAYDAILLDVDNGPDGISKAGNDRLYDQAGLVRARRALRPGGVLAIWSSAPDPAFTRALRKTGFAVAEHAVRARGDRGARHMIWIAVK